MQSQSENTSKSLALPLVDNEFRTMASWCIANANKSIFIATLLFNLDPKQDRDLHVRKFTRALCDARWRGVDVKLLLGVPSGVSQARGNRISAQYLTQRGLKVRCLRNPEHHLKFMLFDAEALILGSHNLTPSAVARNFETSVFIKDEALSVDVARIFDSFWAQSTPYDGLRDELGFADK